MNTVVIDKSDAEMAAALAGCEVGVPKTLTITVTPVADDDRIFVATVDSVEYSEEEEAVEEEPEAEDTASKPYRPKAAKGSATAVEAMV